MAATSKSLLKLILIYFGFLYFSQFALTAKLNVPRVLLPFSSLAVINFTLEVTGGGCYKWQSVRPEIASVQMVDVTPTQLCSTRAIVTVTTRHPQRQTSLVFAQDEENGIVLHCDVIVDVIYALEIVRTTAELYLDDAPEMIIARAKDKNGDTFSSLEGLLFHWSLITDTDSEDVVEASSVLKILPFGKSKYDAPRSIHRLEEQGHEGYMVLLEGKTTGSAKITTRLLDDIYKNILSEEVSLFVVANVILNPTFDVYLLVGSRIHYKVERLQQGKAIEIKMPNDQFYLEILGSAIVELDAQLCDVIGLSTGTTSVRLKDKNMGSWEPLRQPISRIHVVDADHLELKVEPYGNWLLEIGRPYWLLLEAFDKDGNKIFPSDDLGTVLNLPERSFQLLFSTPNGTYSQVIPLLIGTFQVEARLLGSGRNKLTEPMTLKKTIEVCEPVTVDPPIVILPWDPNLTKDPMLSVTLKAKGGGDVSYAWSSDNPQIAGVDNDGQITAIKAGAVNITASSSRNNYLNGRALVVVMPVIDLHIVASEFETEVDQFIRLPVAMYGDGSEFRELPDAGKVAFTDCRTLALKVDLSDSKKFEYYLDIASPPIGGGCVTLRLKALSEGSSQVSIRYFNGVTELKKSVAVAAYKKLQPLVSASEIVLALGSSKNVGFIGGPRAWILKPESHFKKLKAHNESIATALFMDNQLCDPRDAHIFVVICLTIGNTVVELKVGNNPSTSLPKPLISLAKVIINCGIPSSISLQANIVRPKISGQAPNCLTSFRRIPVQCYRNLEVVVTMLDDLGRSFDNVSSIAIQWDISNLQLAVSPESYHLSTKLIEDETSSSNCLQVVDYVYEMITLLGKPGAVRVKALVAGYRSSEELLQVRGSMSNTLDLELVEDAVIIPEKIAIFNHPDNVVNFNVHKGSGHFDINPKSHSVANVYYEEESKLIKVVPLMDGSFTLTAVDLCLESESTPSANVRVTGIKTIDVMMSDKVELNKEMHATVTLLDPEGHCLPVSVSDLTNLHPIAGSNIISVKPLMGYSENPCLVTFAVQGMRLGHTTLIFQVNVTQTGAPSTTVIVASDQMQIQVFSPLRVYPSNLTLISGAVFQVVCSGGPQPQAQIEYFVKDQSLATVSPSGMVTALGLGRTTVMARAIGVSPDTGASIIYSQDETEVFVIELVGIRIHAPLTRMKSGTEMLVYVTGINDQEVPFTFASARPSLLFEWSVSDKEIARLHSIYEQCGILSELRDSFVVRLNAERPGQVTLEVKVYSESGDDTGKVLSDTLAIQVFEKLDLISPALESGSILLTPNTEMQLQTNRDFFTRVAYEVISGAHEDCIQVDSAGILKTGHRLCQAAILITAHEEFGVNQSINALVEVKPASYLVLSSSTVLTKNERWLTSFPVGGVMTLHLSLHDNVGNKFHVSSVFLNYRPNRYDHIEIIPDVKNTTYTIRALKSGVSVIKFWHSRNSRVETYINFVSEENIFPSTPIAVIGDVVCFKSPLLTPEGNKGNWRSNNGLVAAVDPQNGLTSLESIGSATIQYEISPEFVLRTDVNVRGIDSVAILEPKFTHVTNAWPGKTFDVPVVLLGEEKRKVKNLLGDDCFNLSTALPFRHRVPFICELSFSNENLGVKASDVFDVESMFDLRTKSHLCRIRTVTSTHSRMSLSAATTDLSLTVHVPVQGLQPQVTSLPKKLPFTSSFHPLVEDLHLSSINPMGMIPVSATDVAFKKLQIIPADRNILEILPSEVDRKSTNLRLFPVRLKEGCWEPGEATVNLDFNWENENVLSFPVRIRFMEPASGLCRQNQPQHSGWMRLFPTGVESYKSYVLTILSIIGTGIAVLIGYWSVFGHGVPSTVSPDAFSAQQSTRSFLYRPPGIAASAAADPIPPGRTLLWSESTPVHVIPPISASPMSASPMSSLQHKSNATTRNKFEFN